MYSLLLAEGAPYRVSCPACSEMPHLLRSSLQVAIRISTMRMHTAHRLYCPTCMDVWCSHSLLDVLPAMQIHATRHADDQHARSCVPVCRRAVPVVPRQPAQQHSNEVPIRSRTCLSPHPLSHASPPVFLVDEGYNYISAAVPNVRARNFIKDYPVVLPPHSMYAPRNLPGLQSHRYGGHSNV